jgi:hypothetical protein
MNDFTKEELQWIANTIGYYESDGGLNIDEHDICESVYSKIQCMIDNYDCDHFGVIQLDDEFKPISPETCLDCGKIL